MKKLISIILVVSLCACFFGCGKKDENPGTSSFSTDAITSTETEMESSETTKEPTSDESAPEPSPMDKTGNKFVAVYGKRTGTDKTYTGLEPLEIRQLPVVDPENIRGTNEAEIQHSFGVSKDGKPHEISVNNQKLYSKYNGLCLDTSSEKVIYLTFDCGYENGCTEKILDTLKDKKVHAAFFVTKPHVESCPELVARMINEGHTVGNHSVNHPNFSKITRTQMVKEIEELDNYLRVKFGYSSPFFRFPEGACSESALELVESIGYKSVFWSSAYADWDVENPKGEKYAFDTVTARLHPGCVLLLHAVSPDNADALGAIIDFALLQGYTFKSL